MATLHFSGKQRYLVCSAPGCGWSVAWTMHETEQYSRELAFRHEKEHHPNLYPNALGDLQARIGL